MAINTARSADTLNPERIKNRMRRRAVIIYRFLEEIFKNFRNTREKSAIIPIWAPEMARKW